MKRSEATQLDQYFTKDEVASACCQDILAWLVQVKLQSRTIAFFEPSAGGGSFLRALSAIFPHCPVGALDLKPNALGIKKGDFLLVDIQLPEGDPVIVIGNPPFGHRAHLATDFINRGLELAPVVAFILPLQLRKWSAQSRILPGARLLLDRSLAHNSFLLQGKDYDLRCCFQVWVAPDNPDLAAQQENLRIQAPPATHHPDFEMWQYNCTKMAEKYFGFDWDFAVPRQGFVDFSMQRKPTEAKELSRRQQWIFFKASSPRILKRLRKLDFVALSHHNTGTPGFGKADVVALYNSLYPD